MKLAFVLYDNLSMLDFIGFYDPLTRLRKFLPDLELTTCALKSEIRDSFGLELKPQIFGESLYGYDGVFFPGGLGVRALMNDDIFISWIKSSKGARLKISVSSGALLLGAAGFLKDKKATSSSNYFELLKPFCKEVIDEQIVEDDGVITSKNTISSLNLGLYCCEKFTNKKTKQQIANELL